MLSCHPPARITIHAHFHLSMVWCTGWLYSCVTTYCLFTNYDGPSLHLYGRLSTRVLLVEFGIWMWWSTRTCPKYACLLECLSASTFRNLSWPLDQQVKRRLNRTTMRMTNRFVFTLKSRLQTTDYIGLLEFLQTTDLQLRLNPFFSWRSCHLPKGKGADGSVGRALDHHANDPGFVSSRSCLWHPMSRLSYISLS